MEEENELEELGESLDSSRAALELGYISNKVVRFRHLKSIYIKKFRSLRDRTIELGENVTLITGKNGTMKSCMLGLVAEPFDPPNNAKDIFGNGLKTRRGEVFRLSTEKDRETYQYYLNALTIEDRELCEPIRFYRRKEEMPNGGYRIRHRVTVGIDNKKGRGLFSLNTSYINLKRLFPIIDTTAKEVKLLGSLNDEQKKWVSLAYNKIMQRDAFGDFNSISDHKTKYTFGPKDAHYDFNSISSGEDNLGNILIKMLAFEKHKNNKKDELQGVFCIDELDASLHPVALVNLFTFLFDWAQKNNIQVVTTTHSLFLLDHCLRLQNDNSRMKERIKINVISTRQVGDDLNYRIIHNPTYKDAYKELTMKELDGDSPYKVYILCEDEVAKSLMKKIVKKRSILNGLEFLTEVSGTDKGTSYKGLITLGKNGKQLLEDAIIVLDADVPENSGYKEVKERGVDIFKLPDISEYAIERRIVQFILELTGDDSFFIDKEKLAFSNEFQNKYHIDTLQIANQKIDKFKNWQKENKRIYEKAVTKYINENPEIFAEFKSQILDVINRKRSLKGLPMLEY